MKHRKTGALAGWDGCEVRRCDPYARVRPCVPCVSRVVCVPCVSRLPRCLFTGISILKPFPLMNDRNQVLICQE